MKMILSILVGVQIIASPIYAEEVNNIDKDLAIESMYCLEELDNTAQLQPHFKYYHELIIEKHRPDLLEEWKQVDRDREAIDKKIREYNKEKRDDVYEGISNNWYTKHAIVQQQFLSAVKERESEKIKISLSHLLSLKKSWNIEMKEALKE
ncbi:hypothetical protein CR194_02250 [Salipaludibacillus keqinensis]|uniref:Uncharacterized protein n=1 Tax=Salipaludibacillus keqinensis TaxID=2045207 RepID=A0A323TXN1_9BACI|nr:hypothetical protein [Salipaludibacillus keqinensis]PYZ94375.1 hypothetical protein CR194_02250 [Salipaludibacillus keqinensis]